MTDGTSNNIQIQAFSSDGYQITLTLSGATLADLPKKLNEIRAAGYLPKQPDTTGSEQQAIATVMRHVAESGAPVIAAYPHWKYEGKYGEYKFASIYLDSAEDIAQFEAQSGLKLNELPLCDGEAGVRRKYGKAMPKEVAVKRSFDMLKIPDGTNDEGKPRYRYEYVTKLPITRPGWSKEDSDAFVARWKTEELTEKDLVKALNVTRWSEWQGTLDAANTAVTEYIKANLFGPPAQPIAATGSTAAPTRIIDCPTHLLEEGDQIIQTYKTSGNGPAEMRYEVLSNWGKTGNGYRLKLKNLATGKEDILHWTGGTQALFDGPKVRAYANNPDVCVKQPSSSRPLWNGQLATATV